MTCSWTVRTVRLGVPCLLGFIAAQLHADDLTADGIPERNRTASATPIQRRIETGAVGDVVNEGRGDADLPDDQIVPHKGHAFRPPGSLTEAYDEADRRYLEKTKAARAAWFKAIDEQIRKDMQDDPIRRDPETGEILRDPKTGHAILRAPPGFSEEEYNREVTRIVMEHRLQSGNEDPGDPRLVEKILRLKASRTTGSQVAPPTPPASPVGVPPPPVKPVRRMPLVLVNVAVVLLLGALAYWRILRKRA